VNIPALYRDSLEFLNSCPEPWRRKRLEAALAALLRTAPAELQATLRTDQLSTEEKIGLMLEVMADIASKPAAAAPR